MNRKTRNEKTNSEIYDAILNLRSTNAEIRTKSILQIPQICINLGSERTTSEFLTFILNASCNTENDWALIIEQFSKIEISKYSKIEIKRLLEEMQFLTELDSKVVRSAFCECIDRFMLLDNSEINDELIPNYLEELLKNDWSPVQEAALSIIAKTIYRIDSNVLKKMISSILPLSESEIPSVRRCFVEMCEKSVGTVDESVAPILFEKIKLIVDDSSPTVLCKIPTFFVNYVQRFSAFKEITEPLHQLLKHSNWNVRCNSILCLTPMFRDQKFAFNDIYQFLEIGSKDKEPEVRMATCQQLHLVLKVNDFDKEKISTMIKTFCQDTNQHCRASVAANIPLFSRFLGIEFGTTQLLDLIADQSREVKLVAIEGLKSKEITRQTALDCILTLVQSECGCREKQSIIEIIPSFVGDVEDTGMFSKIVQVLLGDEAIDVRMKIVEKLPELIEKLGKDWFNNEVVPIIVAASKDKDYKIRQIAVIAITKCNINNTTLLEILEDAAKDEICNVRLVVAKYIPRSYTHILTKLRDDRDPDVSEFARSND